MEKASVMAVFSSMTLKILSFGIVIETFKDFRNSFNALYARRCLFLPSNLKGSVKMPKIMPWKFSNASANPLVAPDPNPPPRQEISITISWPSKSLAIRSFSLSAAAFANSVFNPVPNPCVNSWPNKNCLIPAFLRKARTSVSATTKEALCKDLPISETLEAPPPPMPITFILALNNESELKFSSVFSLTIRFGAGLRTNFLIFSFLTAIFFLLFLINLFTFLIFCLLILTSFAFTFFFLITFFANLLTKTFLDFFFFILILGRFILTSFFMKTFLFTFFAFFFFTRLSFPLENFGR